MSPSPLDREAIFNAAPGNYLLLSPDFTIIGVTDAYLAVTMTSRESILGRGLFEVFPDNPDDPNADGVRNLRASLLRVLASGRPDRMALQKYDVRRPEKDGGGFEERHWSPLNTPVLGPDGTVQCIIHWVEDVTEIIRLKQEMRRLDVLNGEARPQQTSEADAFLRTEAVEAYRRLSESERRYRFLADAVPQLIWTADAAGSMDYCNERWFGFTNLSFDQLRGEGWLHTVHPEDLDRVVSAWSAAVRTGADRYQVEYRMRDHTGAWRGVLTTALPYRDPSGAIIKWFGTTTDIHDRLHAEEQMRQAQRLQSVGKLAGGMAHEVNNMMTAVLSFGEFVLSELGPGHPQRKDVEEMIRAGTRASDVTRQLLAFSRQQVLRSEVLDVNLIVGELGSVLERLLGSDRRLEVVPAPTEVRILADRGQIEQVLINLVVNARDATGTDGVVLVRTGLVEVSGTDPAEQEGGEVQPGRYARIAVRDNGVGMSPETRARAFEPFFTTKAVGQGTGLGLSMVHGIVNQSGGYVKIDSAPGAGTEVAVYLPVVEAAVTEAPAPKSVARGKGETILVVEDQPLVRSLAQRTLETSGYRVFQAPNGSAALEFLRTHAGEVDLVLTDIVMPRLNGRELADRIREQRPGLRILFMSGYGGDDILQRGLTLGNFPFIAKPFTPAALAAAVREQLDRAPPDLKPQPQKP